MDIKTITWQETMPLRHQVLWPNKPLEFCKIDDDELGLHFGAFIDDKLICVASVYLHDKCARLRKFATDPHFQHQGIGSKILAFIIDFLKTTDTSTFWCDARESALGFYARFGMQQCSERFYKSEVPYLKLSLAL
ncbi:GNAT family N-acetyltransferase [Psychromonas sp. psych-6C06]|uniref:GNAT family N-acetyltransferase n=1 Tax=Psychromonas sp. psych-6C06 TaxID=2058089 RepID=UPI000C3252AE|nr:GNAT family N-acetyltransferase [Psychromonas sp. psych-6C06]PKF63004.1 GNAT family N-acetyltransferase [Psychromonas sp. psych-6C06]